MKNVALINDLSGFGRCSLTAAIPVISALGITGHPMPTAVLTGQSGYPVFHCSDMTDMLPKYTDAWKKNKATFDGIYSGYLTGPKQIESLEEFIKEFRNEHTFVLVDPVMGDNGSVYGIYSAELLQKMKELSMKANMITPNLTEACLLADVDYESLVSSYVGKSLLDKTAEVGKWLRDDADVKQDVIITGIKINEDGTDYMYNLAVTDEGVYTERQKLFDRSFSGTGDLFASTMCGLKINGHSTHRSMEIAGQFIHKSIMDTISYDLSRNDGINFEKNLMFLMKEGLKNE
ncbi:MAG: pyridoxamine kinase [Lachnospiraceae bacterium]|nr:pyridoxamine kinase [Lachnospiraceae bacterium]